MIHSVATLFNGRTDGRVVAIRHDGAVIENFPHEISTLLDALANWTRFESHVEQVIPNNWYPSAEIAEKAVLQQRPAAVLPRTFQALYGSAYGNRAARVFQKASSDETAFLHPLIYQGSSDCFLASDEACPLVSEQFELDFEPEIGVIVDYVPQGTTSEQASPYIRLITLCNDFTYRKLIREERPSGFGFIAGKPLSSLAPLALTPETLGAAWKGGRLDLELKIRLNEREITVNSTAEMEYSFFELIARAAMTRPLQAGTLICSGTITHSQQVTPSCIVEIRAQEAAQHLPLTAFLRTGDVVSISLQNKAGIDLFGVLRNTIA